MAIGIAEVANESQHGDMQIIFPNIGKANRRAEILLSRPLKKGINVGKRKTWELNASVSHKHSLIALVGLVCNLCHRWRFGRWKRRTVSLHRVHGID